MNNEINTFIFLKDQDFISVSVLRMSVVGLISNVP